MDRGYERLTGPPLDPSGPPPFPPPPASPEPPTEPGQLRLSLRADAERDPEGLRVRLSDPASQAGADSVPVWLWQAWGTELGAGGADLSALGAAAAALGREVWLWVMGEREWDELAGLLYGRAVRLARQRPGATSTKG